MAERAVSICLDDPGRTASRLAILLRRPHPRKRVVRTCPFFGVNSSRLVNRDPILHTRPKQAVVRSIGKFDCRVHRFQLCLCRLGYEDRSRAERGTDGGREQGRSGHRGEARERGAPFEDLDDEGEASTHQRTPDRDSADLQSLEDVLALKRYQGSGERRPNSETEDDRGPRYRARRKDLAKRVRGSTDQS